MMHMKRITKRRKQVEKALKAMNIKYSLVVDVFIYIIDKKKVLKPSSFFMQKSRGAKKEEKEKELVICRIKTP